MKATAQMGQYEIYEIIGKGGLATIFLARDTNEGPESPLLALKCMNPEAANHEMAVQGFFQEIKLLRSFKHQNLLTGEDSGKQRGVHYVVTQFIDGQNLRSINNKLQSTGNIMSLLPFLISEVLAGLDYLHEFKDEKGKALKITHNDLTPGNILVGYEGEVKIADFGAATFEGHPLASSAEPEVMGTLSYLAPEKLLGKRFDNRADIYAVGVMLYELALGRPPYQHREGESDMDVLERITKGQYDPIESIKTDLPEHVSTTITQAMALKPKKRFKNAKEMALQLGIDLDSEAAFSARERRQFLLGTAMKSLFYKEYQKSARQR